MEESDQSSSLDIGGLPARFKSLEPVLEQATADVVKAHGVNSYAISVSFVTDGEIGRINEEALHRSGSTDVIAFDLSEDGLPFERVGDIYISIDSAIENSARFGVKPDEEILRLAIHGVLHVLGYDDTDPVAKEKMTDEQERLVKRFASNLGR